MPSNVELSASPKPTLEHPPADQGGVPSKSAVKPRNPERVDSRLKRAIRASSVPQRFLALLLVVFFFKGIFIALVFPPYTGHDEVTHYAYLKIVAEEGRVPLIPDLDEWRAAYAEDNQYSDWDQIPDEFYEDYARYTTADWFANESVVVRAINFQGDVWPSGWIYTGNHPPLFYLLMTPIFWLVSNISIESQVHLFRMATIPFGMLTVVFAYLTVRTIFPRDRFLAMTVPAFVAFQPQISYEASMLNNDILAIMFTSAVVWLLAVGLRRRFPLWSCLAIGVMFGLAMLSKSTAVVTAAMIACAMIFGLGLRNVREWLAKGAITAGVGGLLALPWLFYMLSTYGDPTALNRVSELQSWWNEAGVEGRSIWSMLSSGEFFWARWRETWGDFGWRLIPLDTRERTLLLRVLLWITLFATVGLAVYGVRFLRTQREINKAELSGEDVGAARYHRDETLALMPWQLTAVLVMGVACVLGYYSVLQFGTTFSLTQARYYFPMIVPAALLFMLGIRSWFPRRTLPYVGAATFMGLVVLNLIIYTAYVIPYWNPSV